MFSFKGNKQWSFVPGTYLEQLNVYYVSGLNLEKHCFKAISRHDLMDLKLP